MTSKPKKPVKIIIRLLLSLLHQLTLLKKSMISFKMANEAMERVFEYIESNREKWIGNLSEAVAIRSVSAWKETRPEIDKMVHWVGKRLENLGATIEYCEVGFQVSASL